MSKKKETTQTETALFTIGEYAVTVDADQLERLATRKWNVTGLNGTHPIFASLAGGNPQLLAGFILKAKPVTFCDQLKRGNDYRAANLRISPNAGVKG